MISNIPLPLYKIKDFRFSLWLSRLDIFLNCDESFTCEQILKADCYIYGIFSEVNDKVREGEPL